jgi:VanZ family protein
LAWGAVILVMTSWPSPPAVIDLTYTDEFAHLGVYAILGWLAGRAMIPPRSMPRVLVVLAAIACFGALDELHQLWIPNRFATLSDWIADLAGATIGLFSFHLRRASLTPGTTHST